MNILTLIDENVSITFEYYNLSKALYEEFLNYMKLYKLYTNQYCQKIVTLESDFENKILKFQHESNKKIHNNYIIQFIKMFPDIIKKQIFNYFSIFDKIEEFITKFNDILNQKITLVKFQQDKYNECKSKFIKKCQEIDIIKTRYFNILSETEDIINKYLIQRKKIEEYKANPNNTQINFNFEQYKKIEEKMTNLIKETKNLENNYISSIESSKSAQKDIQELSNKLMDLIKSVVFELLNKYKGDLFELIGLFKNCFQIPLTIINIHLEKMGKSKEQESLDNLLNNLYNKNISTINIFPNKYKLKIINKLNNNENIFSMSSIYDDDLEKSNDNNEELSEITLSVIKAMYKNFSLLANHKIDIKLEEEKINTSKLSKKLFLNIQSFNDRNNSALKEEEIFTEKNSKKLEHLLDIKRENRIVFLKQLNKFRTLNEFCLSINHFIIIGKLLNIILSKFEIDKDFNIVKNCIILSQTYYFLHLNQKIYLKTYIEEQDIFKEEKFWDNLITFLIKKEMENKKKNIFSKNGFSNIAFGVIYTFIDTMYEFRLNCDKIQEIIKPKIEFYKFDKNYQEEISQLIKSKNENNKLEENYTFNELMKIIDNYNINTKKIKSTNIKEGQTILKEKEKNSNLKIEKNKINIWEIENDK